MESLKGSFQLTDQLATSQKLKNIVFSAYLQEREVFLTRKNLNTAFAGYNKIKANVEPYIISHDMQSFPTILRSIPDKRDPADFLFVNL